MRPLRVLAVALLPLVVVVATAPLAAAMPVVQPSDTEVTIGQEIDVTGAGWPASTMVRVELCGDAALNGSVDCDQFGGTSVGVRSDGTFGTRLRIGRPSVPCPCVVKASGTTSDAQFLASIRILGFPEAEPSRRVELPEITRLVRVSAAHLEATSDWTTWFGAAPSYRLVVTLRNTGTVALHDVPLSLAWGKGPVPTGFAPAPDVPSLEPGEQTTIEAPVRLDPLAIGGYDVVGRIDGIGAPVEFRAHTSHYPWGLVIVPALVGAQLTLLRVRNRLRDHLRRRDGRRAPEPAVDWLMLEPPALDPRATRSAHAPMAVLDLTAAEHTVERQPVRTLDAELVVDLVAVERLQALGPPVDDLLPARKRVDLDLTVEERIDDLLPVDHRRR